jgi:glycerol-3-phosphate dehydrogenase
MTSRRRTVLILGAGINGCALARELALNGLSVVVVDTADVAGGTTAYSSRLIHGGLRYLEYGEFDLVRESLAERGRLLRLAPQFVRPLELFVPVRHRLTGLVQSARRFLGWDAGEGASHDRGLWLIRMGLWMYDTYARDRSLPKHRIVSATAGPPVDPARYQWQAAYFDAQVAYPERFTLALLADACQAARERGNEVRVLTYHEVRLNGRIAEIRRRDADKGARGGADAADVGTVETLEPAAIVNATGAWVDQTLAGLPLASPRLIGGTKGTHLLTARPDLIAALDGRAIYAEAADGRPFFILPLAGMTLIGTTDEPYEGNPYRAVASRQEIDYLIASLREVFPQIPLVPEDIAISYSGVRPLPYVDATVPGAITRRHSIKLHDDAALPLFSIIGGKLTTCRALAEEAAETVLEKIDAPVVANSRERVIPGGQNYPSTSDELAAAEAAIAEEFRLPLDAVQSAWRLCGTRTREVLADGAAADSESRDDKSAGGGQLLSDTSLPVALVRWMIRHEWAERLEDLVERRLMLLYKERLSVGCLRQLADLLVAEGRLPRADVDSAVERTIERLEKHFGKRVVS